MTDDHLIFHRRGRGTSVLNRHQRRAARKVAGTNYTHPDALQRVAQKMEDEVWPVDRAFFEARPERQYWIRAAFPIEVIEQELVAKKPWEVPAGHLRCVVLRQLIPGVRLRWPFSLAAPCDPPPDISEEVCRDYYLLFARKHELEDMWDGLQRDLTPVQEKYRL